jgi:hypothetical protein
MAGVGLRAAHAFSCVALLRESSPYTMLLFLIAVAVVVGTGGGDLAVPAEVLPESGRVSVSGAW